MKKLSNQSIKASDGRVLEIGPEVDGGAQGIVYAATDRKTGEPGFVKQFQTKTAQEFEDAKRRTIFLIEANLPCLSPLFRSAPIAWFATKDFGVGHFAPAAPGKALDKLFDEGWEPSLLSTVQLALAVAIALVRLHARGFAHGDLQGNNLFVAQEPGGILRPTLIDFDNYFHPGMPAAQPCIGQELFLAMEQRLAREKGTYLAPNVFTERYMLTVLFSHLILLRNPGHRGLTEPDHFHRLMTAGVWPEDPALVGTRDIPCGYPPTVLNLPLQDLFRRGLREKPEERPTAEEWEAVLSAAVEDVFICDCGGPVIIDRSKTLCPHCGRRYPTLRMVLPSGASLPVDGGGRRVGRGDLGGATTISNHHAIFERFGPEIRLVSLGTNGTFRLTPRGDWVRLPDNVAVVVQAGDRLRFADAVEVVLEKVG